MPAIGPIKRRALIAYLRALGFEPPARFGRRSSEPAFEVQFTLNS